MWSQCCFQVASSADWVADWFKRSGVGDDIDRPEDGTDGEGLMSGHWNNGCLKLTGRVFSGNSWERDEIEASLFSLKLFNHPSSGNVQICVHVGTILETQPWGPCFLLLFFYISSSSLWLLVVFEQLRRLFFRATQLCLLCTCSGCLLVHVVRCLCPPPPTMVTCLLCLKVGYPLFACLYCLCCFYFVQMCV